MKVVERKELSLWERSYAPALIGGVKVTLLHAFKTITGQKKVCQQYPEEPTAVPENYRGAPYLVKDTDDNTKCVSCQLCEFVCPPKAIRITPPGPDGGKADRPNAEKMPEEFEIDMLRCIFCGFCQEVCPEEAIFLKNDFSLSGGSRDEMIYDKEKLLSLGGTDHSPIRKWEQKQKEAEAQDVFPVNE